MSIDVLHDINVLYEAALRYMTITEQFTMRVGVAAMQMEGSPEALRLVREALADTVAQMFAVVDALDAARRRPHVD